MARAFRSGICRYIDLTLHVGMFLLVYTRASDARIAKILVGVRDASACPLTNLAGELVYLIGTSSFQHSVNFIL